MEHSPQLNITQSELTPFVSFYFDNLLAQRDAILERYGLTPETAEEFCNLRSTDEDRETMHALYENMVFVIETKQIPPIEKEKKYQLAQEIMGDDFFGIEAIEVTFDIHPKPEDIPDIPYSLAELERAKKLGEQLILRIGVDDEGDNMTLGHVLGIIRDRADQTDDIKQVVDRILNSTVFDDLDGNYFMYLALKNEWKLVKRNFVLNPYSGEVDPDEDPYDSQGHNLFQQTAMLREYLYQLGFLTHEEYEECSDDVLASLSADIGVDYPTNSVYDSLKYQNTMQTSLKLMDLTVNRCHRRTLLEVLYDWFLQKQNSHETLLERHKQFTRVVKTGTRYQKTGVMVVGRLKYDNEDPLRLANPDGFSAFVGTGVGTISQR